MIAIVIAIMSGLFSLRTYYTDEKRVSADFMLRFDQLIEDGTDGEILGAIDAGRPILKEHGGAFTDEELDRLLADLQLLATAYNNHVINDRMTYDAFSYDLEDTHENKEVAIFIANEGKQTGNDDLYNGFIDLAMKFEARDQRDSHHTPVP